MPIERGRRTNQCDVTHDDARVTQACRKPCGSLPKFWYNEFGEA